VKLLLRVFRIFLPHWVTYPCENSSELEDIVVWLQKLMGHALDLLDQCNMKVTYFYPTLQIDVFCTFLSVITINKMYTFEFLGISVFLSWFSSDFWYSVDDRIENFDINFWVVSQYLFWYFCVLFSYVYFEVTCT
jgi:hypothetical protein